MKFLPLTRQLELEQSSPESIVSATAGTFFYRKGNDLFFFVNSGVFTRIEVSKKAMLIKLKPVNAYTSLTEENIVFATPNEIWQKTGVYGSSGWKFIGYGAYEASDVPI
jgi:hypothetical protein